MVGFTLRLAEKETVRPPRSAIGQHNYDNCLWVIRVMEPGKHWMSLKLIEGGRNRLEHHLGSVRDGAACDKDYRARTSTDAWHMRNTGSLWGDGKQRDGRV
jgi:hypothetical protein